MTKVLVGLPTYDDTTSARQALMIYGARADNLVIDIKTRQLSALCWNFNTLYAAALNDKTYDYFLLIHADIIPLEPINWIRKLIGEMESSFLDILSVVSPLKNRDGLTSTALVSNEHIERRLSTAEILKLPKTFNAANVTDLFGWQGDTNIRLLVNTGLMLLNLRQARAKFETMYFKTRDAIEKRDGKFVPVFVPEDWDFSEQAHERMMKVAATRMVKIAHRGGMDWMNDEVWGKESDVS